MERLANFDVSRGIARPGARVAAQLAFGIGCAAAMGLVRLALDSQIASAGPFALVYPTILIATLFGHWRAGLLAYILTFAWAWYVVLPYPNSFRFQFDNDPARVAVNVASSLVVLVLAEAFRRAVRQAMAGRDAEIARRSLLLRELEHRTRNNFALVLSLLELQKKRAADPQVRAALEVATARIHSFAAAYANLAESQGEGETVAMKPYLGDVIRRLTEGAFDDAITVRQEIADIELPRDVAVAIGLFTNEALTNSAKYAFPDGRPGRVDVRFEAGEAGWKLFVDDDGVGDDGVGTGPEHDHVHDPDHGHRLREGSGLGTTLMRAFAQQADARYEIDTSRPGRRLQLVSI